MDTRVSQGTRIEVVTEGVLTRMLQQDQGLEDTAMIIFDEFHERHLHGDLGLALALESRAMLRPDLKLLVMSATLDPVPICALLGEGTNQFTVRVARFRWKHDMCRDQQLCRWNNSRLRR